MESFFAFAQAALPWVAVGLLLAVFCARGAGKKKSGKEEKTENYGTEGMCLGMCFGTAIGTAIGNNTGIGITLGRLIGLFLGSSVKKEGKNNDQKE